VKRIWQDKALHQCQTLTDVVSLQWAVKNLVKCAQHESAAEVDNKPLSWEEEMTDQNITTPDTTPGGLPLQNPA
jgi:hypothetical protein